MNTEGVGSEASASSSPSKAYSIALDAVITARPRPPAVITRLPNCDPIPTSFPALGVIPCSNAPA